MLLRSVLNNMFMSHAEGVWAELKAADFSKKRKGAVKTRGYVTISREASTDAGKEIIGDAVKIPKGHIFKTIRVLIRSRTARTGSFGKGLTSKIMKV